MKLQQDNATLYEVYKKGLRYCIVHTAIMIGDQKSDKSRIQENQSGIQKTGKRNRQWLGHFEAVFVTAAEVWNTELSVEGTEKQIED